MKKIQITVNDSRGAMHFVSQNRITVMIAVCSYLRTLVQLQVQSDTYSDVDAHNEIIEQLDNLINFAYIREYNAMQRLLPMIVSRLQKECGWSALDDLEVSLVD